MEKNHFWSPYVAGIGLGFTLLATFYFAGWGLAASSAFSLLAGVGIKEISSEYAQTLKYFAKYLDVSSPLKDWVLFEVIGVFIGALTGSFAAGNFRIRFNRVKGISKGTRFLAALIGGILIGFSSRLARGCTSGVALSGGAELVLAGWIFVMAMFAGGFLAVAVFRRLWT